MSGIKPEKEIPFRSYGQPPTVALAVLGLEMFAVLGPMLPGALAGDRGWLRPEPVALPEAAGAEHHRQTMYTYGKLPSGSD